MSRRLQPPRGGARPTQRADAGHETEFLQPRSASGANGFRGKVARSLANFQGRSAAPSNDVDSPAGPQKGSGQPGPRPRPGEIEAQPDRGPLGSPAIGVRVAPGESARVQQAASSPQLSPRPLGIMAGSNLAGAIQRSAPPEDFAMQRTGTLGAPAVGGTYDRAATLSASARPLSPRHGQDFRGGGLQGNDMPGGLGSPRQPSPSYTPRPGQAPLSGGFMMSGMGATPPSGRAVSPGFGRPLSPDRSGGPTAPGQKIGPQKPGMPSKAAFGRSYNPAADQLSAMSTVSVASFSEDSVQAPRMRRMQQQRSQPTLTTQQRNPATLFRERSPPRSARDASLGWKSQMADVSPRRERSQPTESPRSTKNDLAWSKAGGLFSRMPLAFDRGMRKGFEGAGGGPTSLAEGATVQVDPLELPISAKAVTDIGKRQQEGSDARHAMTCSLEMRNPPDRASPSDMIIPAGAATADCTINQLAKVFKQPPTEDFLGDSCGSAPSAAELTNRTHHQHYDSSHVKAGFDYDVKEPTQGHEVMEDYLKALTGRSMKLGRQLSEPPRSREKSKKNIRKNLHSDFVHSTKGHSHEDYTKDESTGAVVPCVSSEIVRQSESHSQDQWHRKGPGEFKSGHTGLSHKLAVQKNQANFRVEALDKALDERSESVPALRRNPVLGEHCDAHAARPLSPSTGGLIEPAAGMSTNQLAKAAAVRSLSSDRATSTCRVMDHLESPVMTSILKNSVAKDADRIRMFREVHDRPFVQLCSAMAQIRDVHVKDAQRIRNQVSMGTSHGVASLLQQTPRSESCGGEVRATKQAPKDSPSSEIPAAGLSRRLSSPGRFTPAHTPFRSLQMEDALKWVC